ncbi:hypothetical protein Trydic_g8071 [Trypoxylus dichotomus]
MGRYQPAQGSPGSNASTKRYSLAQILGRQRHWSVLFIWPKLNDMDRDDMWFQQDNAACHTADVTMDISPKFSQICTAESLKIGSLGSVPLWEGAADILSMLYSTHNNIDKPFK